MKKIITKQNIVMLIALVIGFGIGYFPNGYIQNKTGATSQIPGQRNSQAKTGGQRFGGAGGGFVQGEILSVDDQGITVKGRDGGSKIVIFGSSAKVLKSVEGSKTDLTVGTNVMINGTQNSDGSVTASSVSIRNDIQPQLKQ